MEQENRFCILLHQNLKFLNGAEKIAFLYEAAMIALHLDVVSKYYYK